MQVFFELLEFAFIIALVAALGLAVIAGGLMILGVVGYMDTHNPIYAIPFIFGLFLAGAMD